MAQMEVDLAKFRIRELIEESRQKGRKVTQTILAKSAGVAVPSIWKIVEGKTKAPDPQILIAIAEVFTEALGREVTIDDLIDKQSYEDSNKSPGVNNVDVDSAETIGREDYAWLPLYGEIPCGDLSQVGQEHIIDRLPLPKWLIGPAQFALRAKGDSMMPSIQDGDLLLIEPGNRWENKDIVIAWVDGEVTCKRLQINHTHALLVPDNRDYNVLPVTGETLILGRVIGRYEAFINGWKP